MLVVVMSCYQIRTMNLVFETNDDVLNFVFVVFGLIVAYNALYISRQVD
jgi:hypothetical protein